MPTLCDYGVCCCWRESSWSDLDKVCLKDGFYIFCIYLYTDRAGDLECCGSVFAGGLAAELLRSVQVKRNSPCVYHDLLKRRMLHHNRANSSANSSKVCIQIAN